jgi:hypothetical protein
LKKDIIVGYYLACTYILDFKMEMGYPIYKRGLEAEILARSAEMTGYCIAYFL